MSPEHQPTQESVLSSDEKKNARHKAAMEKQKEKVDAAIAAADDERGIALLLTGNGKGKTSSAFGMVMRALGYGQKVGVVQFIKGVQLSGEEIYLRDHCPGVEFHQMGTGFTWDKARPMLEDPSFDLVVLDELTYMLSYDYLPADDVLAAIAERPREQSVVVTGRGGGSALRDVMDTVSEVKEIKHAYKAGIKARQGVDY